MNTQVKICGVRSIQDAQVASAAGADFIGLNFVPTSKRVIDIQTAKKIVDSVKNNIKTVGIFHNAEVELVNNTIESVGLDLVQLHGEESPEYVKQIKTKVIKRVTLGSMPVDELIQKMNQYGVYAFLLDRPKQGEGDMIDMKTARKIASHYKIFFAGGLTPKNVGTILRTVKSFGVDVAGGIETNGVQDAEKVKEFINVVKGATP